MRHVFRRLPHPHSCKQHPRLNNTTEDSVLCPDQKRVATFVVIKAGLLFGGQPPHVIFFQKWKQCAVDTQTPPTHFKQSNESTTSMWGEGGWADTPTSMLPGISRKRKMRSKFWWFTGFCNSHYVSHFAAFFIVARAKTSTAESFLGIIVCINAIVAPKC